MAKNGEKLKIGVIGPAGFGGSYLVVELINRGHRVVGLSRNPQRLGTHDLYESRPINLETSTEGELAMAISDLAVVVCEYGPHTAGHEALQYMPFIEMIRKIILAVKRAKTGYFVMVGGTGSLHVPHEDSVCVADSKDFFLAYRRGIADSHAHVTYMEERLGPIGRALRVYRDARLLLKEGKGSTEEKEAAHETINAYEAQLKAQQDASSSFIKAARASLMFFEGNTSFDWTYVSPSALYRPGRRTGRYEITISNLPLRDGPNGDSPLDGKLLGISAADLAIAISDEVESRKHKQQHWTATGDLSDDTPAPSYFAVFGARPLYPELETAHTDVEYAEIQAYLVDLDFYGKCENTKMSAYTVSDSEFQNLEGKVILVTGGAAGIGRAIVDLAHRHGAKVAFCDVDETRGKQVQKELGNVFFKKCDISDWNDLVNFFQDVHSELGPIDAVISNAAINRIETLDEPNSGADWYLQKPDVSVLNVNMAGTWYVTKCAIGFFRKNPETKSQLVLFGSAASFFDTPPCYTYCASKAAVLGLMRAMRTQLPKMNITVNMIAPWMTDTEMVTDHIRSIWKELPANTPKDVATASLLPAMRPDINGKSFFIHGGNISDLEDKLDETQPLWLGTDLDKQMREGQRRLIP